MPEQIAIFAPSLSGGGAERVMVNLAGAFTKRGLKVDLVLAKAQGPCLAAVPPEVRLVDLRASSILASVPQLVRYLRQEQPTALLSALDHANVIALWARRLAGVPDRVVVSVHSTLSIAAQHAPRIRGQLMPFFARRFYPWADIVVAVSKGVAEDLAECTGLPRERIQVIYNPVVTSEINSLAESPLDHPWFVPGEPPLVLGAGRLSAEKDFPTLIRAFARARQQRGARLVILGEGEERPDLEALIRELGLGADVALPGFVDNPYAYMARAAVLVLSSRWEGFGNVLAEAMACGTPVVSTDCPSGPAEILEGGRWGPLVPMGDVAALTEAILAQLDSTAPAGMVESVTARFHEDRIVEQYLDVLMQERQ
jgi:glycosyltransferase involved in cell wall biosynthesis